MSLDHCDRLNEQREDSFNVRFQPKGCISNIGFSSSKFMRYLGGCIVEGLKSNRNKIPYIH